MHHQIERAAIAKSYSCEMTNVARRQPADTERFGEPHDRTSQMRAAALLVATEQLALVPALNRQRSRRAAKYHGPRHFPHGISDSLTTFPRLYASFAGIRLAPLLHATP